MSQGSSLSNLNQNQFLQASHQTLLMLEKSKNHVEGVLDFLPNVFAIINEKGRVIKGNDELARLLGESIDHVIDCEFEKLFQPATWNIFQNRLQTLSTKDNSNQLEFELPTDALQNVSIYSWQIRPFVADGLGGGSWYIVFGSNVTAIREYEKQLSQIFTSIPLGILRIDDKLTILAPYSAHSALVLGRDDLDGKPLHDVLFKPIWDSLSLQEKEYVRNLSGIIGFPDFQFDLLKDSLVRQVFFPAGVQGSGPTGKWIGINYDPIIQNGIIVGLLLILEDRTQIEIARKDSQLAINANAIQVTRFTEVQKLNEALRTSIVEDLEKFTSDLATQASGDDILAVLRTIHTIKGTARIAGFSRLMSLSHSIEDLLKATTVEAQASHKWKKNVERFTEIYSEWREYRKIARALAFAESEGQLKSDEDGGERLLKELEPKLQLALEKTVKTLQKKCDIAFNWDNTTVPSGLKPILSEILLHILTNAIDHGIESIDERVDLGKSPTGSVVVSGNRESSVLKLSIANDGANLNRGKIAAKALKIGLITAEQAKAYTDQQIYNLIFVDGFSVKDETTEISGRGIGLAAVRANVERLGGEISVRSRPEGGTIFDISLPMRAKS